MLQCVAATALIQLSHGTTARVGRVTQTKSHLQTSHLGFGVEMLGFRVLDYLVVKYIEYLLNFRRQSLGDRDVCLHYKYFRTAQRADRV